MGKITRKHGEPRQMCDVAMAADYIGDIGGKGTGKVKVWRAYSLLAKLFPHEDDPDEQWTLRRVRSFLEKDAALVKFREMVELHRAAEIAKSERELIAQARKDHADFIAKTASLRSLLEHQDQDFHGPQIEGLGGVGGRVDRTGIEG